MMPSNLLKISFQNQCLSRPVHFGSSCGAEIFHRTAARPQCDESCPMESILTRTENEDFHFKICSGGFGAFVWTYCTCWCVILVLYSYVCRDVFLEQHLGFGDTLFRGDIFGGLNLELGLELWSDYC